jgi:hypothetical protein
MRTMEMSTSELERILFLELVSSKQLATQLCNHEDQISLTLPTSLNLLLSNDIYYES